MYKGFFTLRKCQYTDIQIFCYFKKRGEGRVKSVVC